MYQLPGTPCFPVPNAIPNQGSTEVYLRARMRLDAASAGRGSRPVADADGPKEEQKRPFFPKKNDFSNARSIKLMNYLHQKCFLQLFLLSNTKEKTNFFLKPPRLRRLFKARTAPLMAGDTQARAHGSRVWSLSTCLAPTPGKGP